MYRFGRNTLYGINEDSLKDETVKLYEYVDDMKVKFNSLEESVNSIKDCYVSSCSSNLLAKFEPFQDNFEIIVSNFEGYVKSILKVIDNYNSFDASFKDVKREEE